MTQITINRVSLESACKNYDIGRMRNTNHWHIRVRPDGECYVSEDTSYCVSDAEFRGREGCTHTIEHAAGWGDWDTTRFNSPEEATEAAGTYAEQAQDIILRLEEAGADVKVI